MKLEIKLEVAEYQAFVHHVQKAASPFRGEQRGRWFATLAALWLSLVMVTVLVQRYRLFEMHIPSAVLALAFLFMLSFVRWRTAMKSLMPRSDGSILAARSFDFVEDGIHESSENSESRHQWSAVTSVEETPTLFLLMLDSVMAIIVPKRCFADVEAIASFRNFIEAKVLPQEVSS